MPLPAWMRFVLYATAALNTLGAFSFLPAAGRPIREMGGLPIGQDPLYLGVIAAMIFVIGLVCLWAAIVGRGDRQFLLMVGSGKLAFIGVMAGFWLAGEIPGRAVAGALPDLVVGVVLIVWLLRARGS